MKIVLQVVDKASVEIDHKIFSSIKQGFLILIGIENGDSVQDVQVLIEKILKMRTFFSAETKKHFELSVEEISGEILIVSQFTIPATFNKGRRPEFVNAMNPGDAKKMYEYFVEKIKSDFTGTVQTGEFGAEMKINLVNNGPITYFLNSKDYV